MQSHPTLPYIQNCIWTDFFAALWPPIPAPEVTTAPGTAADSVMKHNTTTVRAINMTRSLNSKRPHSPRRYLYALLSLPLSLSLYRYRSGRKRASGVGMTETATRLRRLVVVLVVAVAWRPSKLLAQAGELTSNGAGDVPGDRCPLCVRVKPHVICKSL